MRVEQWSRSHKLAVGKTKPIVVADDLDPSVAHETLQKVSDVLGCDPDHDSIQKALDSLFALVTGEHDADTAGGNTPLSAAQLAICREVGCSPENFKAIRRAQGWR